MIKKNLNKENITLVPNKYYYLLSKSDLLIGNSSSGIIESCSFKIRR